MERLEDYRHALSASGELRDLRCKQRQRTAWLAAEEAVLEAFRGDARVHRLKGDVLQAVARGEMPPREAGDVLARSFWQHAAADV